jgi:hypothetical protein
MRYTLSVAVALVVIAGTVPNVQAVFVDDAAHYVKRGYHFNQQWPWPFECPDRIAVREPFCVMVNNGWRRQNLLGPHHFDSQTNQLTTAGELRVQWIMTQAPPERRNIFVERTLNQETNTQRLAVVREYAAKVAPVGSVPHVEETYLVSEGRPAAVVDATNMKFQQSMRPPVLPAATSSGTSAGQ